MADFLLFFSVLAVLVLFFLALHLFGFFSQNIGFDRKKNRRRKNKLPPATGTGRCPVCSSQLAPQDRLLSKVYPSANGTDQRCIINGCPYCYPVAIEQVHRMCPVCKKHVPENGYLITRMFIKPGEKRHVHIIGCSECHKK